MSSVGEIEMMLLGFREPSLALKLEKVQSHSILQLLPTFLALFSSLTLSAGDISLLPAHKATRNENEVDEPVVDVTWGCLAKLLTYLHCPARAITPQANLMTPLNPAAQFPLRHLRGTVPHFRTTWGLMNVTFQQAGLSVCKKDEF